MPTTVGESNVFLDKWAVARVSYHTVALAGWTQLVRYSPYPRNTDGGASGLESKRTGASQADARLASTPVADSDARAC